MSRKAAWALSAALVFVLGVAGVLYMELHRLSEMVEEQRTFVLRTQTRDALLGRSLPDLTLPSVRGDSAPILRGDTGPHAVWSVDPDRCIQCLEGLGEWRRVARSPGVRGVVILEGTGREEAVRITRETGLDGTVLYDSTSAWQGGDRDDWPAMVMLGVDPEGRIQSVASRESRGSCRWSAFDYTQAALKGMGEGVSGGEEPLTSTAASPATGGGP